LGKSLRLVRAARSLELRADPIAHAGRRRIWRGQMK
jgi:hypothetical protein